MYSKYDGVVDSNEYSQSPKITDYLIEKGHNILVSHLPIGDYFFAGRKHDILIERKTSKDFAASVLDERLWKQASGMKDRQKEIGCHIAFLIEGSLYQIVKYTKWSRASILGIYNAIRDPDKYGIEIMGPFPSDLWTKMWMNSFINDKKKIKKDDLRRLRKALPNYLNKREQKRYVIEGLPRMGPKTADRILKKHGSIKKFMNNIDDSMDIPGIGEKTIKGWKNIVEKKY